MGLLKCTVEFSLVGLLLVATAVSAVTAQSGRVCKKSGKRIGSESRFVPNKSYLDSGRSRRHDATGVDGEKSISVSKSVYVSFCVTGAPVKVNGWNRSEVRAFVRGRPDIGFKVREVGGKDGKPVWVEIFTGEVPSRGERLDACLSGNSIELDVPHGASITILGTSGESSVEIDAVHKARIDISSGDVALSNVGGGIEAQTDVGGVTVRNSGGKMRLKTTAGNIVAYDTQANEIGDNLRAMTNSGAITMQSIGQKEVEASSISGSISFVGETKRNGNYSLTTTNGLITLAIPPTSSFKLKAAYGGSFSSELPLVNIFKNASASAVFLTGDVGRESGATVSLRSYSGTIRILEISRKNLPAYKP